VTIVKEKDYQKLFKFGKDYLLNLNGVTEDMLNRYLYPEKLNPAFAYPETQQRCRKNWFLSNM